LRISAWYAQQGLMDEALHHALAGGDEAAAVQLVGEHLGDVLNREDGPALDHWLARLPEHLIYRHPALLMARAYSLSMHWRLAAILPLVERAESLLVEDLIPRSERMTRSLRCGLDLLRSQDAYWRGDFMGCLASAQRALADAPAEERYIRGNATLYLALARQRLGEGEIAIRQVELTIAETSGPSDAYTQWLRLALALLYWYQGDLTRVVEIGRGLVGSPCAAEHRIILGWAYTLLGMAWYERNQLGLALQHYAAASQLRHQTQPKAVHGSLLGQAAVYLAQAALDEADELGDRASELADDLASPELVADSHAFMALLALAHGEATQADQRLPASNVGTDALALWGVAPTLIRAKILLAQPTDPLLQEASALLQSLLHRAESVNNTRQVIATLVLQSLVLQALERPRAGVEQLRRAIELAEPRDFKRVFLDEGPMLVSMLQELARRGVAPAFISHLLMMIPEPEETRPVQPKAEACPEINRLVEALTYRELDVLELLEQRMSNQEIADKLVISTATVRTHLANIYQKLQVGSRRQAVLKTRELGIL
jgi:LuxR family maltose regulon positive regulatory protein